MSDTRPDPLASLAGDIAALVRPHPPAIALMALTSVSGALLVEVSPGVAATLVHGAKASLERSLQVALAAHHPGGHA